MSVHDYKIAVDAGSRIVVLKVGSFDLGRSVYVVWGGLASFWFMSILQTSRWARAATHVSKRHI